MAYTVPSGQWISSALFCFHPLVNNDGDYVKLTVTGFLPSFAWEVSHGVTIHWSATHLIIARSCYVCQTSWAVLDEVNGQTYQGSYDTGMSFQYSVEVGAGGSWVYLVSLVRAKDLLQLSETWYVRASSASQLYSFT